MRRVLLPLAFAVLVPAGISLDPSYGDRTSIQ